MVSRTPFGIQVRIDHQYFLVVAMVAFELGRKDKGPVSEQV